MREVRVLTVSSNLPIALLDGLLTSTEALLHEHGASRVWVDATQPGTTVLAEFPSVPGLVVTDLAAADLGVDPVEAGA